SAGLSFLSAGSRPGIFSFLSKPASSNIMRTSPRAVVGAPLAPDALASLARQPSFPVTAPSPRTIFPQRASSRTLHAARERVWPEQTASPYAARCGPSLLPASSTSRADRPHRNSRAFAECSSANPCSYLRRSEKPTRRTAHELRLDVDRL